MSILALMLVLYSQQPTPVPAQPAASRTWPYNEGAGIA